MSKGLRSNGAGLLCGEPFPTRILNCFILKPRPHAAQTISFSIREVFKHLIELGKGLNMSCQICPFIFMPLFGNMQACINAMEPFKAKSCKDS